VEVGGYVLLCKLILEGLPLETLNPLHGEICAEQEARCVSRVQTCLNHLLGKTLNESVYNCCHIDDELLTVNN